MRSHAKAASVLVSIAMLLGIVAPAASAAPTATTAWVYQTSFGNGEVLNYLSFPQNGIAVEGGSGNILAPLDIFGEVKVFAPDASLGGTPLTQFSAPGIGGSNIAVDRETDAVYVNEGFYANGAWRYLSDGAPTPTYTPDPDFAPDGSDAFGSTAIDPTTNELLAFNASKVRRLDPETGELISSFSLVSQTAKFAIAVGLDGTIYITGEGEEILCYSPDGTLLSKIPLPGNSRWITVDPATGFITLVVNGRLLSFTPGGKEIFDVPMQAGGESHGIAIDSDRGRLYNRNPASGNIDTYVPAPYAGVEIPTFSNVTTTEFHVSTEVDPGEKEGGGVPDESTVHFEYRLVGEESWTPTPDQEVNAAGSFAADVAGLTPDHSTYEVRAVASNSLTTHTTEPTKVTTAPVPPATETGAATDVTETGAVLNGKINPFGLPTNYYLEYGETTAYGSRVPVSIEATAGSGFGAKLFSRTITSLTPGTTYHFRLVATNSVGTIEGSDRTLTTVEVGGIPRRAYEQVTPAEKGGAVIVPIVGMQAEAEGNAISYTTKAGSNSSAVFTRMISTRGSSDWKGNVNTDPPLTVGSGALLTRPTLAISDDFTHALVVSNRALTPGGIDFGGNVLRVDLATGAYELVAASSHSNAFNSFVGITDTGRYLAGAPDLSWVVFNSQAPLVPGAPADAVYRWSEAAGLELVSILPNGDMTSAVHGSSNAVYKTVSADGSRIYFNAFGGSEEGVFLQEGSGPATPVSLSHIPGDPTTPRPATLVGVNKDGRYAFLASRVPLTSDAPGTANSETGDLYRYDASEGTLEYLGVPIYVPGGGNGRISLGIGDDGKTIYFNTVNESSSQGPFSVWHDGTVKTIIPASLPYGGEHPSPNGRYYVLGYEGALRLYDAETDQLHCMSCLPDGTPVSASPPQGGELHVSNRYPEAVNDSGEAFFSSSARLVAADVNGTSDVYAYREGSVHLVSPGNAPFDAFLAEVSADGEDVFFTTAQKLVGRDNDEATDIYDSRINGGLPAQSPPPPQECLRDDCKATPNAGPELPFGGSEALSGPGNVDPPKHKKCGKGKKAKKVKGKVRCVKKHKSNKNKKGGNR